MEKSLHDLYGKTRYDFGKANYSFYAFLMSFNQDMESFEVGLKEDISLAIKDPERRGLKSTIKGIEDFLTNENYTDEEKEKFVYNEIDLDISILGITHLEWLRQVVLPEMKKNL